jgi:trafficking protein particle complex subunit 11
MLGPLLSTWFACAKQLGDVELCVKLLIEMLGHGSKAETGRVGTLEEDLLDTLKVR